MVMLHQTDKKDNFVDPGIYQGFIEDIRTKTVRSPHTGEYIDMLVWVLSLEYEGDAKKVEGSTSISLHPRSKAFGWIKKILGDEPPEKFDTDELRGKKVEFRVDLNKNKFSKVDEILKAI